MRGGIMLTGLSYSFWYQLFGAEFDFLLDKAKRFKKPYWFWADFRYYLWNIEPLAGEGDFRLSKELAWGLAEKNLDGSGVVIS